MVILVSKSAGCWPSGENLRTPGVFDFYEKGAYLSAFFWLLI